MPRPERRALLLLLALAVAGQALRHLITRPGEPPGQLQLLAGLAPGSPAAHRDSAIRLARPLAPGERIDVESADISELSRLPRVGLGLAKTIVNDRKDHGPFGSLDGLDRVPGIGSGLLKVLAPHVVFSGTAGQRGSGPVDPSQQGASCPRMAAPLPSCLAAPLNINTASTSELDALPGIGPSRAAAILRYREAHGPFGSVEELIKVPGFGPAALARVKERVTAR